MGRNQAAEPIRSMYAEAFRRHIRNHGMRLLKFDNTACSLGSPGRCMGRPMMTFNGRSPLLGGAGLDELSGFEAIVPRQPSIEG